MKQENATPCYIDNTSCIRMISSENASKRTKHVDVKYHFIRERVEEGDFAPVYIHTYSNPADGFTKGLGPTKFAQFKYFLGIVPTFPQQVTSSERAFFMMDERMRTAMEEGPPPYSPPRPTGGVRHQILGNDISPLRAVVVRGEGGIPITLSYAPGSISTVWEGQDETSQTAVNESTQPEERQLPPGYYFEEGLRDGEMEFVRLKKINNDWPDVVRDYEMEEGEQVEGTRGARRGAAAAKFTIQFPTGKRSAEGEEEEKPKKKSKLTG